MAPDLSGKRIIITGSSRGMGRHAAIACLRAGAKVLLTGSDGAELTETVKASGARKGHAAILVGDLMDQDTVNKIVEAAHDAFGGVDVLVNNAGVGVGSIRPDFWKKPIRFWMVSDEDYRRFIEINTMSAVRLSSRVAPEMIERGWGRILNVTTSLNTMLLGGQAPYGVSKAGLEAITAIMASDLEGTGVTANVLTSGGAAATRLTKGVEIPEDKLIPADCLAAPVMWLASDEANGISGRRFLGFKWDPALPLEQAAAAAGDVVAWTGHGAQMHLATV